jgi:hypothetical protein
MGLEELVEENFAKNERGQVLAVRLQYLSDIYMEGIMFELTA